MAQAAHALQSARDVGSNSSPVMTSALGLVQQEAGGFCHRLQEAFPLARLSGLTLMLNAGLRHRATQVTRFIFITFMLNHACCIVHRACAVA